MSNPLEDLKKLRGGTEKPRRKRVDNSDSDGKRPVPMEDLGIGAIPTPEELWEYFQKEIRYRDESESDPTDENTDDVIGSAPVPYAIPFRTIRKLKRARDDYKHGPVKVYTKEEIEEYEKQRDAKG